MLAVAVVISAVFGSLSQRLTGMGFALATSPVLVVLLGPQDGVLLVNVLGASSSALILAWVWRDVDWPSAFVLAGTAVLGAIPGVGIVALLEPALLSIVVGALIAAALVAVAWSGGSRRGLAIGRRTAGIAGLVSGFMNAAAGVGGPALGVLGVTGGWSARRFAATVQPVSVCVGVVAVTLKIASGGGNLPMLGVGTWIALVAALPVGVILGDRLARQVPPRATKACILAIALIGATAAIARGAAGL